MLFLSGWRKLKFVVLHAWSLRRDTAACSCSASTSSAVQSTTVPRGLISCPNQIWAVPRGQSQLFAVPGRLKNNSWTRCCSILTKSAATEKLSARKRKKSAVFYLPCCRNPSDSADRLAATILKQDLDWWVMEALAVMIDWRIFSSFFAFLQPPLFADIHIPSFGWSVSWCWSGGAFLQPIWQTWWNTSSMQLSLPLTVFATANAQYPEPPVYNGFSYRIRDFLCALLQCLYMYYCMKPHFVICY